MDHSKLQSLFDRYLANRCSAEELLQMIELLQEAEAENVLSPQMEAIWQQLKCDDSVYLVDWERIKSRVLSSDHKPKSTERNSRFGWLKVAAAVTLLMSLTAIWYQFRSGNRPVQLSYQIVHVAPQKISTLMLSDGSKIVLNSGSTFRYPDHFTDGKREVYLEGEAYFEVAHENKRPFIIHSGKLNTQVLGTTFNVSAYREDSRMMVTVLTGKVSVEETTSHHRLFVSPNERLTFNTQTNVLDKIVIAHAEDALAWQQGKLIFEDASLADVCTRLSLKYGVNVRLKTPALQGCQISAVFDRQTLPEALHVIKGLIGVSYHQTGNRMELSGEGCH